MHSPSESFCGFASGLHLSKPFRTSPESTTLAVPDVINFPLCSTSLGSALSPTATNSPNCSKDQQPSLPPYGLLNVSSLMKSAKRSRAFQTASSLISADAITPWLSYFAEWRMLSYQTTASQRLFGRHGRFEDLFVQFWLPKRIALTVGQYRMLNQWDVSRRLSLSEPVAFSAGVAGAPSRNARLQSLRSFSLAGRAPSVRATIQTFNRGSVSDGWFHEFVVPMSGELSAPLGSEARRNASFEIEARPKGFLYETYYRRGLSSAGASMFFGRNRRLANATGILQIGKHSLLASAGTAKFRQGYSDFRLTAGDTWVPRHWFGLGARVDHQTTVRRRPAFVPHVNFSSCLQV